MISIKTRKVSDKFTNVEICFHGGVFDMGLWSKPELESLRDELSMCLETVNETIDKTTT